MANATATTIHELKELGKYWCGFAVQPKHTRASGPPTCERCISNKKKAFPNADGLIQRGDEASESWTGQGLV
jgi:hypothetical protein